MPKHVATVTWNSTASPEAFVKGRYNRAHTWRFDGGIELPASPSPSIVPAPHSSANAVDPEEAFVAAISSCHMLTFLHRAQKAGVVVTRYVDEAVGVLTKNEAGRWWVSHVTLRPEIAYAGEAPASEAVSRLHHEAHDECFIANSVRTEVLVTDI